MIEFGASSWCKDRWIRIFATSWLFRLIWGVNDFSVEETIVGRIRAKSTFKNNVLNQGSLDSWNVPMVAWNFLFGFGTGFIRTWKGIKWWKIIQIQWWRSFWFFFFDWCCDWCYRIMNILLFDIWNKGLIWTFFGSIIALYNQYPRYWPKKSGFLLIEK